MRAGLIALIVVFTSCQTHELEPVDPKALRASTERQVIEGRRDPSKVMLVLDRSGSMKSSPVSDTQWTCCASTASGCVGYNPAGDCKWNQLKRLIIAPGRFLDATRDQVRVGLAVFPEPGQSETCSTGKVVAEVAETPGGTADAIKARLEEAAMAPGGGTPSAATLQAVAENATFMAEDGTAKRFVVLVTDGLPNCNRDLNGATCRCTDSSCSKAPEYCLDDAKLVSAVAELKARGVDTFVIGFGSALTNDMARSVLDAAADAGGRAQTGTTTRFFQAASEGDLERVLEQIRIVIAQDCTFNLSPAPSVGDLLEVRAIDRRASPAEQVLKPGADWTFPCQGAATNDCARDADCGGAGTCWFGGGRCEKRCVTTRAQVSIEGDWCTALKQAEPNRYSLEFSVVGDL
jgi:hypothetical protein